MTPGEYDRFVSDPFTDERIAGADAPAIVVVAGAGGDIADPASLPIVVAWLGTGLGADGPTHADVVVGEEEVDQLVATVERAPIAARSLALLLRGLPKVDVDTGLAMESAVYSVLQSGPEFDAWRRSSRHDPIVDAESTVVVERSDDAAVVITLNRPARHNAISTRLRDELSEALWVPLADPSIASVRLRGAGRSFCSGGDLGEFGSRRDPAIAHVTRLARSPARLIHRLADRLTVDVHGATMGGGIEMASFAGYVRAHPDTRIALPEIELGLVPGAGGTVGLTRRIGRQRTAALALTGTTIAASVARDWGLVDEISDDVIIDVTADGAG
jgi:enoyl-CoA hydratase/carnithine racemase